MEREKKAAMDLLRKQKKRIMRRSTIMATTVFVLPLLMVVPITILLWQKGVFAEHAFVPALLLAATIAALNTGGALMIYRRKIEADARAESVFEKHFGSGADSAPEAMRRKLEVFKKELNL